MRRGHHKVWKEGRGIWVSAGFPWVFLCRGCARRAHHATWVRALTHSRLHDCNPGSFW